MPEQHLHLIKIDIWAHWLGGEKWTSAAIDWSMLEDACLRFPELKRITLPVNLLTDSADVKEYIMGKLKRVLEAKIVIDFNECVVEKCECSK